MRQLARALVTEAKEPGAMGTATDAMQMGLTRKQLAALRYELVAGHPQNEDDFESDEDINWDWARWQEFAEPFWTAPMRRYNKCSVLWEPMNL